MGHLMRTSRKYTNEIQKQQHFKERYEEKDVTEITIFD
jgi:hypothetical protein